MLVVSASAVFVGLGSSAAFASNGQKGAFFTGGSGTAAWVNGSDPLVPSDSDNKALQLSSPDGSSFGGFVANALNGLPVNGITAMSYDFQVTTPDWTGGGLGSPRLVVEFTNDGTNAVGNVSLNPVNNLTSATWYSMNATTGAVDVSGGSCGSEYQAAWGTWQSCFTGDTVLDAFLVNDSGWGPNGSMTVQIDNLTLNNTVYSGPGTSKR